ncbi:hypothetical protein ACFSLT_23980 [Novosphingobium resinovorum]
METADTGGLQLAGRHDRNGQRHFLHAFGALVGGHDDVAAVVVGRAGLGGGGAGAASCAITGTASARRPR